jgi:hypothetical protein
MQATSPLSRARPGHQFSSLEEVHDEMALPDAVLPWLCG